MIPSTLIGLLAEIFARCYTRSEIIAISMSAGAGGEEPRRQPGGQQFNKTQLVVEWLNRTNRENFDAGRAILGRLLRTLVEPDIRRLVEPGEALGEAMGLLDEAGLTYSSGIVLDSRSLGVSSRTLTELLRQRNFSAVLQEFERAIRNLAANPREAASAASNILEAICKEYIVQHELAMPSDQSLGPLFRVVRERPWARHWVSI
jgi:hypothetical protein